MTTKDKLLVLETDLKKKDREIDLLKRIISQFSRYFEKKNRNIEVQKLSDLEEQMSNL